MIWFEHLQALGIKDCDELDFVRDSPFVCNLNLSKLKSCNEFLNPKKKVFYKRGSSLDKTQVIV